MSIGVAQLGYLGFEVSDLGSWEKFATETLGLTVAPQAKGREGGAFSLRMDGHEQRLFITPGNADDVAFIGWEMSDEAALSDCVSKLKAAGVPVVEGSAEERA